MEIDSSPAAAAASSQSEDANNSVVVSAHNELQLALGRNQEYQQRRRTMGEVMSMTFEEKRDELVASYAVGFPKLAEELAMAKTSDEAWGILNSQETRHVTEEEMKQVNELSFLEKNGDAMDEDGKEEKIAAEKARLREEAFEKYGVIDEQTGERILADFNNENHRAQLRERMSLFIAKTRTPAEQDRLEAAASYAMHMAEPSKLAAEGELALTKEEADQYEKTGVLPAEYEKSRQERIERQMQMVQAARTEYNRIVSKAAVEGVSACMPHKMPFASLLQNALPLSAGFFTEAMQRFAKDTRMSLTMSNMYPTLMYESKLRLLMYGSGAPNVCTSFRYHETMHSVFMQILGTDKKFNHGEYLEKEMQVCKKMQVDMREREKTYADAVANGNAAELEQEKAEIEKARVDVATFAHGLAVAMKAYEGDEKVVLSPFAGFMERKENAWIELDVPRHSKEQIIQIVQYLQEQERVRQNNALAELEKSFRESPAFEQADEWRSLREASVRFSYCNTHSTEEMEQHKERTARLQELAQKRARRNVVDTEEFLVRFWLHNHVSTVHTCNCYDTGMLFMFEENIPSTYRADLVLRADMVNHEAITFPSVRKDLHRQQEFYASIRRHYTERMRELMEENGEAHLITHEGVDLDMESIKAYAHLPVMPEDAASPSFKQLAEFYYIINKNYGSVERVARMVDFVDEAYAAIYNQDGTLVDDFERQLSQLRSRFDTNHKRRRRK